MSMRARNKTAATSGCIFMISLIILIQSTWIELVSSSFLYNKFADSISIKQYDSNEHLGGVNLISDLQTTLSNRAPTSTTGAGSGISKRQQQRETAAKLKEDINNNDMILVHEREFVSPQVKVQMECQRDKTIIKVNFTQPFSGTLGSGRLDTTKCKLNGNGTRYYEISVNHNSSQCDTQWDSANNSIINTLFIRFHPSLETGGDIAKNIMCRLTIGDLVVGRRPLKQSRNNNSSPGSSSQKVRPFQLTDVVASNSVSTLNNVEQAI